MSAISFLPGEGSLFSPLVYRAARAEEAGRLPRRHAQSLDVSEPLLPTTISSPPKTVGDPILSQWSSAFLLGVARVHKHGFVDSPVWPSCGVFVRKGARHSPPARG